MKKINFKLVFSLFSLFVILVSFNHCKQVEEAKTTDIVSSSAENVSIQEEKDGNVFQDFSEWTKVDGLTGPIQFITSEIQEKYQFLPSDKKKTGKIKLGGQVYEYNFFVNRAYKCGASGYYTFLAIQKQTLSNPTNNWLYLHGGGVSFCRFDETKNANVCGRTPYMAEQTISDHFAKLKDFALDEVTRAPKPTVLGKRLSEGYRLILPTMCDHDLYGGLGTPFPNNPYWQNDSIKPSVDGQLATLSALQYIGTKYPSQGKLFIHGSSAGSAGAYHTSIALLHNGITPTGVILDSGASNTRDQILDNNVCSNNYQDAAAIGYTVEERHKALGDKIGIFYTNPSNWLMSRLTKNGIPYFLLVGDQDDACCGTYPAIDEAKKDGFTNNCQWKYDEYSDLITAAQAPLHQVAVVQGADHVVTDDVDTKWGSTHQAQIEAWVSEVLKTERPIVDF